MRASQVFAADRGACDPHKTRIPYKSMVYEFISKKGWGGAKLALEFIEKNTEEKKFHAAGQGLSNAGYEAGPKLGQKSRPWVIAEPFEAIANIYLPALSASLREAVAQEKIFWVRTPEAKLPQVVQMLLESHLIEGVFLNGLENFSRVYTAAIWARRWQLATKTSGATLLWLHEKAQPLFGVDMRLEWVAPARFEVRRGFGIFEALQNQSHAKEAASYGKEFFKSNVRNAS